MKDRLVEITIPMPSNLILKLRKHTKKEGVSVNTKVEGGFAIVRKVFSPTR